MLRFRFNIAVVLPPFAEASLLPPPEVGAGFIFGDGEVVTRVVLLLTTYQPPLHEVELFVTVV